MSELEAGYSRLKRKYPNLPSYQNLDKEFEIEAHIADKPVPENYILRAISNSIANYLFMFLDYLHNILYPNPSSLIVMEESRIYTDEEKKQIETILRRITYLTRRNIELTILKDEKKDSKFISDAYSDWKSLKKQLSSLIGKAANHWKS
jgi:hypothetical protein